MSSRKLSKQQQSRIDANQKNKLATNSDTDGFSESYNNCNGRVISHFGQQLEVETLNDDAATLVRCHQRANLPALVTGDYVVWEQEDAATGVITAVAQRRNIFHRPGFGGKLKAVAANIDIVLVVVATAPQAFMNLIDRYLVAISALNLDSMLVLNKTDLLDSSNKEALDNLLAVYENLNYSVARVSAKQGDGVANLVAQIAGKTAVLVGQSGVGKSSLINQLGGEVLADTGELSTAHEKGTHTTTTARLFHLEGFDLIDSPGIREFDLGHIEPERIVDGFPELKALSAQCKFRDCRHDSEPGCAVRAGVQSGDIARERMESYQQIVRSITES